MQTNLTKTLSGKFLAEAETDINEAIAHGANPGREYLQTLINLRMIADRQRRVWSRESLCHSEKTPVHAAQADRPSTIKLPVEPLVSLALPMDTPRIVQCVTEV